MRKNLDAFSTYTDDQLWNALEQVFNNNESFDLKFFWYIFSITKKIKILGYSTYLSSTVT